MDAAAADPAAAALALIQGMGDAAGDAVVAMEQQRRQLKQQLRDQSKDIDNARTRQKRVLEKARTLSDDQLLGIVAARAAKAKAKGKAKAKAKG